MKITNIRWSEVQVSYTEPPEDWDGHKTFDPDLYKNAHVIYDDDNRSLQIVEYDDTNWSSGRDILLAKPRLVRLDTNSATFEACWWSSKLDGDHDPVFVPCTVECSF